MSPPGKSVLRGTFGVLLVSNPLVQSSCGSRGVPQLPVLFPPFWEVGRAQNCFVQGEEGDWEEPG